MNILKHFIQRKYLYFYSLKLVGKGSLDNKSALVQVMSWCQTGANPFPEAMVTQFTDAYKMAGARLHYLHC